MSAFLKAVYINTIYQSCPGNGQASWAKYNFAGYLPAATSVTELSARAESSALATCTPIP